MNRNNQVVEFKSITEYYKKEEDGRKPNTVRKLPIGDERERKLRIWASLHEYGQIVIKNAATGESFLRNVTDVSIWEGVVIISWEHPTNQEFAYCPQCSDSMNLKKDTLEKNENWVYYCFGCDKEFKIVPLYSSPKMQNENQENSQE